MISSNRQIRVVAHNVIEIFSFVHKFIVIHFLGVIYIHLLCMYRFTIQTADYFLLDLPRFSVITVRDTAPSVEKMMLLRPCTESFFAELTSQQSVLLCKFKYLGLKTGIWNLYNKWVSLKCITQLGHPLKHMVV